VIGFAAHPQAKITKNIEMTCFKRNIFIG